MHELASQAKDIVIGGEDHQACDQHEADLEAELLRPVVHGLAANHLHRIIEKMAAIEERIGNKFSKPTEIDRIAARFRSAPRPILAIAPDTSAIRIGPDS